MKADYYNPGHGNPSSPVDPNSHRPVKAGGVHVRARPDGEPGKRGKTVRAGGPGSFAGHYGQLILTDGIAPIPRALYLYQGALNLSPQQVWFVSCVLAHKWDDGLPHPRLQELARHATLSLRQIKNIKNSLLEAGLLQVTPRYGAEGEQDANSYDFGMLFDRLEELLLAAPNAPGALGALAGSDMPEDELAEHPSEPGSEEAEGQKYNYGSEEGRMEAGAEITTAGTDGTNRPDVTNGIVATTEAARKDYSFAARYGRIVLRRGVTAMPRALFTYQADLGLSPQHLWFIGYILSFQWSTELPYPSLRKMADNTGYSERQIHRIKDDLVRAGCLRVIERRGADGRDTTSAYDFGELLKTLNTLIRRHDTAAGGNSSTAGKAGRETVKREEKGEDREKEEKRHPESGLQSSLHESSSALPYELPPGLPPAPLASIQTGGEASVSGGVKSTSVGREPHVGGRVNPTSEGGVKPVSVGGVKPASYELESIKEESDKEEEHQQQPPAEIDEAQGERENAYYTLVDVGVIPDTALDLVTQLPPDHILGWVHYYLSVLSRQKSLDNPLGVLVKRLRSGDEPPCVPSQGDLYTLRLRMSWFNH